MLLANFNGKEHLRHRAVSLRQRGFLVYRQLLSTVMWNLTALLSYCRAAIDNTKRYNDELFNVRQADARNQKTTAKVIWQKATSRDPHFGTVKGCDKDFQGLACTMVWSVQYQLFGFYPSVLTVALLVQCSCCVRLSPSSVCSRNVIYCG